jgi:hypothetical protein
MTRFFSYGLLLGLLFSSIELCSQELLPDASLKHEVYAAWVKQFDDFALRFNGEPEYDEISRRSAVASLFNHEDARTLKDSEGFSPEYVSLAKEFIYMVCHDTLGIDRNSEEIFAAAETRGLLENKEVRAKIILRQERVGKDMLKWVIQDIEADFLDFLLTDTTMLRFLPPSSGELDFKELQRAMKDVDYLHYYAHKNYEYNPLSVFFYLLNSGALKIESIQEVKYRIYDIPGWCIILKDFNRNSKNAGWLIDDLYRR